VKATAEKLSTVDVWRVPPAWEGETVVIVASGPSLSQEQLDVATESGARVLGIKDNYRLLPDMDLLYNCDQWWWDEYIDDVRASVDCPMVTQDRMSAANYRDLLWVEGIKEKGLSADPTAIHTGCNSGYQAINLAVHLGVKRIILLGYDMQPAGGCDHWFGAHPHGRRPPFWMMIPCFDTIVEPLRRLGIEVVNCSPNSALGAFPKARIEEVLS
jgi:hypothetical protein